jgi:GntR family phosphonate transport system transcriptional regulator
MTIEGAKLGELTRGDGIALWRKVELALLEEMKGLAPGSDRRLPTERELVARFGVNRHTVRQALRALAEQGLVRTEQGRGTFAAHSPIAYPLGPRTRFTANLLALERAPSRRLRSLRLVPSSPSCAAALGIPEGEAVIELGVLGLADGIPLMLTTIWFPLARFPDGVARLGRDTSVTAFLASCGIHEYRRRSTHVTARPASPEETRLLRQAKGSPVLVTVAVDVDPQDVPVSYAITSWASEHVQLLVEDT